MATVTMYFRPTAPLPGTGNALYSRIWESGDGQFWFAQSNENHSLLIKERASDTFYHPVLDAGENPTRDEEIIALLRTLLDQQIGE